MKVQGESVNPKSGDKVFRVIRLDISQGESKAVRFLSEKQENSQRAKVRRSAGGKSM